MWPLGQIPLPLRQELEYTRNIFRREHGNDLPIHNVVGHVCECPLTDAADLEQINFEKVYLLKDLPANPCHEMLVGELGSPLSKHFKVKML